MAYSGNRGLSEIIFVIVIAVIVMSVFGVDLRKIGENETLRITVHYVWETLTSAWGEYVRPAGAYLWGNLAKPYLYEPVRNFFTDDEAVKILEESALEALPVDDIPEIGEQIPGLIRTPAKTD